MKNRFFGFALALAAALAFIWLLPAGSINANDQNDKEKEKEIARIRKISDEIVSKVSSVSGLPSTREIKLDIVNKQQVSEMMMQTLDEEYPDNSLEKQFEAYSYLGLVPADLDIRRIMVELITEQAGAFYNAENDTFYSISDLPEIFQNPMVEKTLIAHELTHGLQDMTIDLFELQQEYADQPDKLYALMSTIEGMAVVTMSVGVMPVDIYKLPDLGTQTRMQMEMTANMPEMKIFNESPLYLRETLISPYAEGASFIYNYMKENPETPVGEILKHLPISAEQILHFEKYTHFDKPSHAPVQAALDRLQNEDWSLIYRGPLGEFDLRVLMQIHDMKKESVSIATGWDAFEFAALKKDSAQIVIANSVWDDPAEAREFATAFKKAMEQRWGTQNVTILVENNAVSMVAGNSVKSISPDLLQELVSETSFIE